MATYERLDYGSPDGCHIGGASTDLVAFYGETPVDQGAAVTTVSTEAAVSTSTGWGYSTSTQADAIVVAVNALIGRLQDIGITA